MWSTEECQDGLDINNENNDNFNEWTEWTASLIKGKESLKSAVSKSAAPNVIYVHDVMMLFQSVSLLLLDHCQPTHAAS